MDTFTHMKQEIPSCALTEEEYGRQRERQRRLAPGVAETRREEDIVVVAFRPGFDQRALEEMVSVERECCPFFRFAFDEGERLLRVSVDHPDHRPALDAIAAALGAP